MQRNQLIEVNYWQDMHTKRTADNISRGYDQYGPAYRYGWESFDQQKDHSVSFDSLEKDLSRGWERAKGASKLTWEEARSASREAWERVKLAAHALSTPAAETVSVNKTS
jgi:hypothetical protein